jgi:hypothetical protein
MQLELSDEEAELLREILDIAVHDLSYEIASADSATYRETLRHRRAALEPILDAVGGPIPNAERLKN